MASSSQIKDSSQRSDTARNNGTNQLEHDLSSISLLLSELKSQEGSLLNGTSDEQDLDATQEGEMGLDMQDAEVQALLEQIKQLHGFADGVEDRMDTLLAKLDDMLGILDNGEIKEKVEGEATILEEQPEKESDEAGGVESVGQPLQEPQASPGT